jgi:O-antigen/teichoic acid export membrane protein
MYPHGRLFLASIVFSAVLAALVAGVGFLLGVWLASQPPPDPIDNAPIRAVGVTIFVFAPAIGVLSLLLSIPASYVQWGRAPFRFLHIASACVVVAAAVVVPIMQPASTAGSTAAVGAGFAVLFGIAAWCWRMALPRSITSLERTREG